MSASAAHLTLRRRGARALEHMKINQRIHRYLVWQHRWTGLLMTAFLIVVASTGSLLVYAPEIDRIVNPELFARAQPGVPQLSMGEIAEHVEAADPLIRVGYFFRDIPDTVIVRIMPRSDPATGRPYPLEYDHVFADPWTGAILGHRGGGKLSGGKANLMPFVRSIHSDLILGEPGALVLGYVAVVWTIDCFIGFYLTLPLTRPRFWRRWGTAWWVKWKANTFRVNFDLHRAGSLWFWPLLFMFAWSSVRFELLPVYEKVMHAAFSYETMEESLASVPAHPIEHPRLGWIQAQARAVDVIREEGAKHNLRILRPTSLAYIEVYGVYSVGFETNRDFRAHNTDTGVYIDGNTGELKKVFLPHGPAGNTFTNLIVGLHFADFHGWQAYRLFVFVFGFLICMLSVTGVYIWWKKRRVRKSKAHRSAPTAAEIVKE